MYIVHNYVSPALFSCIILLLVKFKFQSIHVHVHVCTYHNLPFIVHNSFVRKKFELK